MPLSKRRRTSRCDGDARASPSNGVLHEVKDAIRKETETLQQVKQAVQRPWWRTGRFLFPLGMLSQSPFATPATRAHLRIQLEHCLASLLLSRRTFMISMRSSPYS